MDKKGFKKKYSIAEVALLVIFALSLLLGHLLVVRRQKIKLSEPYDLDFAGISVSIPDGGGWVNKGPWSFHEEDNDIMLTAQLSSKGNVLSIVQWRYIIAPEKATTFRLLAKRASVGGAQIMKTGQYSVDNALIEWAHAKVPGGIRDVFFGIANLSDGRALEIETMAPSDPELAKRIFEKVCMSLKYEPNDLIEKGTKFITSVKDAGISSFIDAETDLTGERVYIFEKPEEKASGYWYELYDSEATEKFGPVIKCDVRGYIAHGDDWFKIDVFLKFDDRFDQFHQQTRIELSDNSPIPPILLDRRPDGSMLGTSDSFEDDRLYWPLDNAIPEPLFNMTIGNFIDSEYDDMVVDVIKGQCLIVPTRVTKIPQAEVKELDADASYGLRVEKLNTEDEYGLVFFDADKRSIKSIQRNQHEHIWVRSDKQTLIDKFQIE